jgi:hypothetical protein
MTVVDRSASEFRASVLHIGQWPIFHTLSLNTITGQKILYWDWGISLRTARDDGLVMV